MKFGSVKTADAAGGILAHSLSVGATTLKKGTVLAQSDLEALSAAAIDAVTVAMLEAGDVEENEAAAQIGAAIASNTIAAEPAFTGRVNLHANVPGIFFASATHVDSINRVDPAITIATLASGTFVEAGRMVATVKIIPFAASKHSVDSVVDLSKGARVASLKRSVPQKIGLVATMLPTLKTATMDKTARILSERLVPAGSTLAKELRVPHDAQSVANALTQLEADCDLLIVFGASAICDLADVIPAGLQMAGGEVSYFGMPVDPGNLMLMGNLGATPVIGAPGCARSPVENGFDWVLQRLLAKLDVEPDYLSSLGVGGLLMEITSRPQPRNPNAD